MASGGFRPGAGRPKGAKNKKAPKKTKAPKVTKEISDESAAQDLIPLDYMLKVMNDPKAEKDRRDRMAIAAAPFVHSRKGEGKGKKDDRDDAAKRAGAGKFSAGKPPLKVVK